MWVKQCHKPAMTGNGKHTTYIFMMMTGDGKHDFFLPTLLKYGKFYLYDIL